MTIQKKYYFNFKDLINQQNTVEIWQNSTDTLTPQLIEGSTNPFSVELPAINHKFQPVRGTGCDVNIICRNNMQFFTGLYHVAPQEIIIKHFINTSINWIGYMNSELMRESYSEIDNYEVNFNGNDGFALMDRFKFVDTNKANITGVKSQFDIIKLIFQKIALPFNELKICLSTSFYNQTNTDTILHQTYIDCNNFINEDGEAETLRKVIEGILQPYGAIIFQLKGNIIITDIHNLATDQSFTFKRYSMTDYTALSDEVVTGNIVELSNIGYAGTGQEIEISGGKNKQVVSYSPYPTTEVITETLKSVSEFTNVPTSFSTKNNYSYKTLTDHSVFNSYSPATFEISYLTDESDAKVYLRIPYNSTSSKIASLKVNPKLYLTEADVSTSDTGTRRNNVRNGAAF